MVNGRYPVYPCQVRGREFSTTEAAGPLFTNRVCSPLGGVPVIQLVWFRGEAIASAVLPKPYQIKVAGTPASIRNPGRERDRDPGRDPDPNPGRKHEHERGDQRLKYPRPTQTAWTED